MKKVIYMLLFLSFFAFSNEKNDEKLKKLLTIIQGSFNDKVYTITIQKAKEYLKLAPENDKYREKVAKILVYSFVKSKNYNIEDIISLIEKLKLSKDTKIYIYSVLLKEAKNNKIKKTLLLKLYSLTKNKKFLIKLASILYKEKNYSEILKLPDIKEINLYKVIAFYKQKKYKELVNFTEKMSKFPPENKDEVLYYRGLALIKIGKKEKGIKTLEAITFKTPKIIKYIANYYLKNGKYIFAEKYLKMLYLEEKEREFALFYLGYVNEKQKDYQKAYEYYKKLLNAKNEKYKKLAMQRIIYLKSLGKLPKEKLYSIRVVLYKNIDKAKRFIKNKKLDECFVYPYKKLIGVYCGIFYDKEVAKVEKEKLKNKLKIKDIVIQRLEI
ncbi:MAG TPA: tetratricopeptide repeat protein [Persephonella sp.]|nr:tetratricopeptide repeat protein [Hydrogenothermaceae bacterium]HIQ24507.1 tetratricopeptide repeat protein [Persephonella sp.]